MQIKVPEYLIVARRYDELSRCLELQCVKPGEAYKIMDNSIEDRLAKVEAKLVLAEEKIKLDSDAVLWYNTHVRPLKKFGIVEKIEEYLKKYIKLLEEN